MRIIRSRMRDSRKFPLNYRAVEESGRVMKQRHSMQMKKVVLDVTALDPRYDPLIKIVIVNP